MTTECCGEKRTTPYCPQCGARQEHVVPARLLESLKQSLQIVGEIDVSYVLCAARRVADAWTKQEADSQRQPPSLVALREAMNIEGLMPDDEVIYRSAGVIESLLRENRNLTGSLLKRAAGTTPAEVERDARTTEQEVDTAV